MTAFELMDTNQNEALKENKSHPSLKLSKFMNSTPALNTPPPESIDFYHEISLSDISLNRLEHIVEDTGFQEDTALTPLIHSPPQSAASSERKNFHKLNSDFISKHSLFKLRLQRSLGRFSRLRLSYLRERPAERGALAYELDRTEGSANELTDDEVEADDDSFWASRRLRLGSEWTRCRQKLSLIECKQSKLGQAESAGLVRIKNQLKHLSSKNATAIQHFRTNVTKSNCVCDSMTSSQEMCVFCSLDRLSKANKGPKRTLENVYFDHSYTKLPKLHSPNAPADDLDFLNCVDDDALDKMVNERLDKLFSPVDHFSKQCDPLPNLTTEE
ncbi:hypothetical protein BpHYR1_045547 [Brachionus plicatilis]|uniref:Uncharacterized protein n=1 Tax=Brachionus plicatilis TaxID=10195 RepID=A0A3M7Q5D3_BRAPC|nr:hypothetical protein BpHYR1_045547 [Brachionus plicatilis]